MPMGHIICTALSIYNMIMVGIGTYDMTVTCHYHDPCERVYSAQLSVLSLVRPGHITLLYCELFQSPPTL